MCARGGAEPVGSPVGGACCSTCPRRVRGAPERECNVTRVQMTVDGQPCDDEVEARLLLVHYLRDVLGKTGTNIGCDTSNCGACTVHLDGESVKSCTVLAVQADGSQVTTIEEIGRASCRERG